MTTTTITTTTTTTTTTIECIECPYQFSTAKNQPRSPKVS